MTCSEFLAQFDELIDDTATATMRDDLKEHIRGCEHCLITFNTTRKTIEIYRTHEVYELPAGLRERLQKAILAKCKNC